MKLWNHYHCPASIDEALALLAQYDGNARVIAGGTDLLLDLKQAHMPPVEALIDVTRIDDLRTFEDDGTWVTLGAAITHTELVHSDLLATRATCLVESCGVVGGPQVRNVGTLGGNVAHALPAGDGTTSLVALDAQAEITENGVRHWVPIGEMYRGPGQSRIDSTRDLVIGFRFKLVGEREATAFSRIMRPQGVALPVLGCAAWVRLDAAGENYEDVRVCVGPVAKTPVRADAVEIALRGNPANAETLEAAVTAAHQSLSPRTSKYRATKEYRQSMIEVLLRRVLTQAVNRAQTGEAVPVGIGE